MLRPWKVSAARCSGDRLQVIRTVSSEAKRAVLGAITASLPQMIALLPKHLHGDVIEAASSSLQSDLGILELDCNEIPTATLTAVLNHTSRLNVTQLVLKNVALRVEESLRGPSRHPLEAALHAAVAGSGAKKMEKLIVDGCRMPVECFYRFLTVLSRNRWLRSLDIAFTNDVHLQDDQLSEDSIPYTTFSSQKVLQALAQLTSLQSLTLRRAGNVKDLGMSVFSDTGRPSLSSGLVWVLPSLKRLTHLSIAHLFDSSDVAEFLPYLTALQSLNIGLVHNNGLYLDDTFFPPKPYVYQVDAAGSNQMSAALASLQSLKAVKLHSSLLPEEVCTMPAWYHKKSHPTFAAVAEGLRNVTALEELSVVLPQHDTHPAMLVLAAAVKHMPNLRQLCVAHTRDHGNVVNLGSTMISGSLEHLTQLRLAGICVRQPLKLCDCSSDIELAKVLDKLPNLIDFGVQFEDESGGWLADISSHLPERLPSQQLPPKESCISVHSTDAVCCGYPLVALYFLKRCELHGVHALTLTLEEREAPAPQEDDPEFGTLYYKELLKVASTSVQSLKLKHRAGQSDFFFENDPGTLFGLTALTSLSLDLSCPTAIACPAADTYSAYVFPALAHMSRLRTLELATTEGLCNHSNVDENRFSRQRSQRLAGAIRQLGFLSELRLRGWMFDDANLGTDSALTLALQSKSRLQTLELSCEDRSRGTCVAALAVCLTGPRRLQTLVAGPWHMDEPIARHLSGADLLSYTDTAFMLVSRGFDIFVLLERFNLMR